MDQFRISIYWKIFLTILTSMFLSSVAISILYLGLVPRAEIHPQLKQNLVRETEFIAKRIASRPITSSMPLSKILQELHTNKKANVRIFDLRGNELGSCMDESLQGTRKMTPGIANDTLAAGFFFELLYPRRVLTPVISVPLRFANGKTCILQAYYPFTKGLKRIMPRGLPETISLIILGGLTALLARYLTRPLRELTRVAKATAQGNFGVQVKIRSHDEVGELSKSFNNMSTRLKEMQSSRRELFADISHELRSPLARILTDAEILIDSQMPSPGRQQHLKAICNEVKNLDQLIGDLSILAKNAQGHVDISFTNASLQDVISQAFSFFVLQIEEKGITLKQTITDDIGPLPIDPKRIGQIITNLLMNAMRYTPQGGTIEVGLRRAGGTAEVWVRDTGPGIPADKLPFIFERFYRVDKSRSRSTGGSGLGLAIARQFVEAHGGSIRAESELNRGTCITFSLPASV
ncbi:MAG: cell wall metabolism sensor histidine kinase WalK [Deltaproteobacteria bacterium]|nr:cell wall metabolism sensor histidine kinase WalK [Deltaproteobacteria bacterium]